MSRAWIANWIHDVICLAAELAEQIAIASGSSPVTSPCRRTTRALRVSSRSRSSGLVALFKRSVTRPGA